MSAPSFLASIWQTIASRTANSSVRPEAGPASEVYLKRQAQQSLNVVVVGAGLGGLAAAYCLGRTGHKVTVLEQAPVAGEVGAGIQISPNISRLFWRWGIGEQLEAQGVRPGAFSFRRYCTGEQVGWSPLGDQMVKDHGAPYYHIHRADLFVLLHGIAQQHATIHLNAKVVDIEPSVPSLTLESGSVVKADLIVGADGVKSMLRGVVLGKPDEAMPTGDAAYRAIVPVSEFEKDPDLKPFVDKPEMTAWMGPDRHMMMYKIRPTDMNIVLAHPDHGAKESYTWAGDVHKMREEFSDFEPRVQKILSLVPRTLDWRLVDRPPVPQWVHTDGKLTLLGDACHPMLPYRAQGAAMAIEDAAVLGTLLSHITSREQLPAFLAAYQDIRIDRATKAQLSSRLNQRIFHHPDGPEQLARDASMREAMIAFQSGNSEALTHTGNANQWADRQKNIESFSYDAEAIAVQWWEKNGDNVLKASAA
ncbi:FAD/NAD(P)-binding domain-containing protein [Vararia minispora EC-137]|uniref:FAD/NAD(P)-binding domain-containing protein n=1 Tax=Vararia minispora EC-137 TaxID=1314806 RepID=A0ACB8QE06_9AGAM|nr:FAD/NAD(P)-binding domain-containing protein [Vararia minispora EC-137]